MKKSWKSPTIHSSCRKNESVVHADIDSKYVRWMQENLPNDPSECADMCFDFSVEMQVAFPELTVVYGRLILPGHLEDGTDDTISIEHTWLKTSDGKIIDPSILQFSGTPICESNYHEEGKWDGSRPW